MNVLWIFCDELRADALSCYGNEHATIATPNIDSIAEAGTQFDRFYVNSPVCVSSRAAYKTGRYPTKTGIYHNEALYLPEPVGATSFVEAFRSAGYVTVNLGKEHVPSALQAFDHHDQDGADQMDLMFAPEARGEPGSITAKAIGLHAATWPADAPYPPDRLTGHAQRWLRDDRPTDQPWMLRVSYLQPHTPVIVPEPWASRYDDQPWPDEVGPSDNLSTYEQEFGRACKGSELSPSQLAATHSRYHGLVSWIDDQVGELLATLDELKLSDNTVIVFASDHGAQLGELGGAYGKMTFSRWSHQVPFLISGPDLPVGERRGDLAQAVDLGPTLGGVCGVELLDDPVCGDVDGRDLFNAEPPTAVFGAIGYGNPGAVPLSMVNRGASADGRGWPQRTCVRTDRYRLDRSARQDGLMAADPDTFLADLSTDPREEHNLAGRVDYALVQAELEAKLDNFESDAVQVDVADYEGWRERFHTELEKKWAMTIQGTTA